MSPGASCDIMGNKCRRHPGRKGREYMMIRPYVRKVQYYETDAMGIVHHSNHIRWFEEARVDFLEQLGYGYHRLEREGISAPVLEASCRYLAPLRFGEEAVITLTLTACTPVRFQVRYEIREKEGGELRGEGQTSHCYMDGKGALLSLRKANPGFYRILQGVLEEQGEGKENRKEGKDKR